MKDRRGRPDPDAVCRPTFERVALAAFHDEIQRSRRAADGHPPRRLLVPAELHVVMSS